MEWTMLFVGKEDINNPIDKEMFHKLKMKKLKMKRKTIFLHKVYIFSFTFVGKIRIKFIHVNGKSNKFNSMIRKYHPLKNPSLECNYLGRI